MLRSRGRQANYLFIALLGLFVLAIAGGTAFMILRLRAETLENQLGIAAMHARAFEGYLTQSLTVAEHVLGQAAEADLARLPAEAATEQLRHALRHIPMLRSLAVLDGAGRIAASSNPANLGLAVVFDEFLPPAAQRELLRLGAPWAGRDFHGGRPTGPAQPAAPDARIFLPLLRQPAPESGQPAVLGAINPDYFINYFLGHVAPEQGGVDVLRYDGRLLFSTDPSESPGSPHPMPEGVSLEAQEFGKLAWRYRDLPTLAAFRASRRFPLVLLVHLRQDLALAKWRAEARALGGTVGVSLALLVALAGLAFRRQQLAARREDEAVERMRLAAKVFETSAEGIMICDQANRLLSVNTAFTRITGYGEAEVLGQNPKLLASGRHDAEFYRAMWQDIAHKGRWVGEIVNRRKNGELFHEWLSISCLPGTSGEIAHYVGIFSDLSRQKAAEAQLRNLFMAVEQSPSSVVITDLEGRIEYVNRAFLEITGYTLEEVLGHNPRLLQSGQTPPETYAAMWAALSAGRNWEGEFVNRRKDGSLYIEHAQISPVFSDGQPTHYVAVKHDITEARHLTEQLRAAKDAAETANRAKSAFLANMSHELRTPLNAVLGFAQILEQDQVLSASQHSHVHSIRRGGEYLLTLINDILDLAKIEAGRLELVPSAWDTEGFFRHINDMFQIRARQKGIAFQLEVPEPLPYTLYCDSKRLRQIVVNLLGNAVKFTEEGRVVLRVAFAAERLSVEVKDTGIGIPPEDLDKIFDPFHQAGDSRHKRQGTGLGLSIVRKLVEMMDGSLGVESVPGAGSTFRVEIPVTVITGGPGERESEPRMIVGYRRVQGQGAFRVLIADDVADNRALLGEMLEPLGFVVAEAENGRQCVEIASAWRPDMVLMDIHMPELDGLQATRQLRALADFRKLPIVAVSAAAFPRDREQSLAAGCDAHLAKPVRFAELLETVGRLLPLAWEYLEETEVKTEEGGDERLPEAERARFLELMGHGDISGLLQFSAELQASGGCPGLARRIAALTRTFDITGLQQLAKEQAQRG